MATKFDDVDVKCPYYVSSHTFVITCNDDYGNENPLDAYSIKSVYGNTDLRKKHMARFCCNEYSKCRIYKLMLEKQSELND